MYRGGALLVFLTFLRVAVAQDEEPETRDYYLKDNLTHTGILSAEYAYGLVDGDTQKFQLQYVPEFNLYLPHDLELTAILRLRTETEDAIEPGEPDQFERSEYNRRIIGGDHSELELRELYLEAFAGRAYLKIGKQQVVWGTADGLKVLDVVNPQDFREFVLEDFDESRIPLWTFNAEIPIKSATLQLIWIPDQTYHDIPEPDAVYAFTANLPRPTPTLDVVIDDPERPSRVIADSDIGARISTFWKGWDLTASYLYHYDDIPVLRRSLSPAPGGALLTISPEYERTHLFGTTFSNAFGDLTLRGEIGYSLDKYYSTRNPADADGVERVNELSYVIGLDWWGFTDTLLSLQFFQSILSDDPSGLVRDRVENTVTFLARRDFRNHTLHAENIVVYNLNRQDGFVRPQLSYDLRDNVVLWGGFDIFWGKRNDLFGQFDDTDRFIFGVEWGI